VQSRGRHENYMAELKYTSNSKELRNSIQKIERPFGEVHGICNFCGKTLPDKRRQWCRDENDKYGKCVAEYLALRGYYEKEVIRRNKEKYKVLTCEGCKKPIKKCVKIEGRRSYTIDHIQPIALGGDAKNPDNLQILCDTCNKAKTKNDVGEIANQRRLIKEEKERLKEEQRINASFGKKSKWSRLNEFTGEN
jgi:5-methylcytosine-specific restriction endonuclease McrA